MIKALKYTKLPSALMALFLLSCGGSEHTADDEASNEAEAQVVVDKHSYANLNEVKTKHLHLDIATDFDRKVINGSVRHDIENLTGADKMVMDINQITVSKVLLDGSEETTFEVGDYDELLGSPLTIDIKPETKTVTVFYETTPDAGALQWLNPQQTAGKKHPYLFTQGQAILTRTWVPCQDSPGNRITYSADVKVPVDLMAVMSANNDTVKSADGMYHFEMKKPIPSYLIALAVGDLEFASLGQRTGVFTEPSLVDDCVYEFADVEDMVIAAEGLYGDYKWGRYDIIVLPPSFPFGGMENPKLTFATPTILAGDRSLVSLVAHELAHSWSGNLVTNATWDDFWLNEGFTVYFENRIMEEVYGKEYADMLMEIEYQGLEYENEDIINGEHPEDTKLKLDLEGRNPDDGMTAIAYVKGAFFLKTLEATVGREKFDDFLSKYFKDHEFETVTTEMFIAYLEDNLLKPNDVEFNTEEWIYGEGIPDNCVEVNSDKFEKVSDKCELITSVKDAKELNIPANWSTHEWLHFIRHIPADADASDLAMLDAEFGFSDCGNSEIMAEWYVLSIKKGYKGIDPHMEDFLVKVGRRKFLAPIYSELAKTDEGLAHAKQIYSKARPNYHSISYLTIDDILGWEG
ncbi:M1 family metallopeptidase [Paracrocinitomix mangrovi]|uniref:M1 family metallopeptidase n=1 Tax=Paracrocinitomix mangrovi TaxID=2862509 RepID=UPI001C8DD81B|nr:M1 family metallopeptidase [Paracrocinitomix mangrovi]UKN01742.1 M1 family metallopeptidase [Paracrocinitomix mangrovi]